MAIIGYVFLGEFNWVRVKPSGLDSIIPCAESTAGSLIVMKFLLERNPTIVFIKTLDLPNNYFASDDLVFRLAVFGAKITVVSLKFCLAILASFYLGYAFRKFGIINSGTA